MRSARPQILRSAHARSFSNSPPERRPRRRVLLLFSGTRSNAQTSASAGLKLALSEEWAAVHVLHRAGDEREQEVAADLAAAITRAWSRKREGRKLTPTALDGGDTSWNDSWSRKESRRAIDEWFKSPSQEYSRREDTEYFVSTLSGTAAQWTALVDTLAEQGCTVSLVRHDDQKTRVHPSRTAVEDGRTAAESAVEIAKFPAAWTVLLTGPTGAGKSWLAERLGDEWQKNGFASKGFRQVNIAGIPRDLLESTLFGHAKGAFTGANRDQRGVFELCDGGTLFLDEIGELPIDLQPKLLTAVDARAPKGRVERKFWPIGSASVVTSSFHLVCATNRDLREEVRKGNFREDLLARLARHEISVPALSERRYAIVGFYLDAFAEFAPLTRVATIRPERPAVQLLLDLALDPTCPWTWNRRDVDQSVARITMTAWRERSDRTTRGGQRDELRIERAHVAHEATELRRRWAEAGPQHGDDWGPLRAAMRPEGFARLSLLERWEARILLEALRDEGSRTNAWNAIVSGNRLPHRASKSGQPLNPADAFGKRWQKFDDCWI